MTAVTYPRRLHNLAVEEPHARALTVVDPDGETTCYTRAELDEQAAAVARALEASGVTSESLVVLAVPNSAESILCMYATWWLGACVFPLSTKLVAAEQREVLAAAAESGRPMVVIAAPSVSIDDLRADGVRFISLDKLMVDSQSMATEPLTSPGDDRIPFPGRALPSGGSTGRPKVIVDTRPLAAEPDVGNPLAELMGRSPGQTLLVVGPLYHAIPFGSTFSTLFDRGHVVLMTRFDATAALDAIEAHRVEVLPTVPIHLLRMAREPGIETRDLSSIVHLYHSGAPCPEWLKRRWLDLVGPERVYEGFGSAESIGMVLIRGDEWLEHPGSVGRARGILTEVVVREPGGDEAPTGEVGEIFMRWRPAEGPTGSSLQGATYRYWGSEAPDAPDGYVSVGDLGWIDEDGYLFVADRRVDMIITGGVNVYPAEVETAISGHIDVEDVAVIGLPDAEWGQRVHAIISPRNPPSNPQQLVSEFDRFARARLSGAKLPKSYEIVGFLPRSEAGKVRRSALVAERLANPPTMVYAPEREIRTTKND
jgi:bile acid-coenzyme A ligase